jgi:hypothetical protein
VGSPSEFPPTELKVPGKPLAFRPFYLLDRFPFAREITGEQAQKDFIALFGAILSLHNVLFAFEEFAGDEIRTLRQMQDYQSIYLDLYGGLPPIR